VGAYRMTVRRTILLLAATTGYQTRAFAERAGRLGLEVVLATDRCKGLGDPWGDRSVPVRFHDPFAYVDKLEAAARERPFASIVALGDRPTFLAALAAERLAIPYHPPAAVEACNNKYLARERYRAAGLLVPEYFRIALEEDPGRAASRAPFPCVLKPLGLSGSRGVIRADNQPEFVAAFERIKALLESREFVIQPNERNPWVQVESFIPGREFAIEALVTEGRLQVLALFDKPDPLDGPFFEETICVTPSRQSAASQNELIETIRRGVEALGLRRGPLHAEVRLNQQGAWILEMAARPIGGLCARALRFDGEMPHEELILRHALGEDVSWARQMDPASGVMMIPIPRAGVYENVQGLEQAREVPGVFEVLITATPGQKLARLPEGGSYLGFIFARGNAPGQVEQVLRQAHQTLEFQIAATLPVMTSTTSGPGERTPAEKPPPPQRSTAPSGGAGIPAPAECPGSDDTRS